MERTLRVVDGDRSYTITGVSRNEWNGMADPCPTCGAREFDHVSTSGGHYGVRDGAVVLRSDRWDADRPLFTRCRACDTVLYRNPAFDLLFDPAATE